MKAWLLSKIDSTFWTFEIEMTEISSKIGVPIIFLMAVLVNDNSIATGMVCSLRFGRIDILKRKSAMSTLKTILQEMWRKYYYSCITYLFCMVVKLLLSTWMRTSISWLENQVGWSSITTKQMNRWKFLLYLLRKFFKVDIALFCFKVSMWSSIICNIVETVREKTTQVSILLILFYSLIRFLAPTAKWWLT